MISLVIPINHRQRVEQANVLSERLRIDSGVPVEVIMACDNPEIYDLLKADIVVKIPKRIEFTQSVNIGEKFASNELVWYLDDSVTPEPGWGKVAVEAFWSRFPDGNGVMELSGVKDCASRSLTTRKYAYSQNLNNLLWPEYIHCGDSEHYERAIKTDKFYAYPEILLHEKKIDDESRQRNSKVFKFDDMIREERRSQGFPLAFLPDWEERLKAFAGDDPDLIQLYNNFYNK